MKSKFLDFAIFGVGQSHLLIIHMHDVFLALFPLDEGPHSHDDFDAVCHDGNNQYRISDDGNKGKYKNILINEKKHSPKGAVAGGQQKQQVTLSRFREFLTEKVGWLALSSEHSRSTTITNKVLRHKRSKSKNSKLTSQKVWNQSAVPYTPEQVLNNYSHYLNLEEKGEIL